jgi:hypothetical protein
MILKYALHLKAKRRVIEQKTAHVRCALKVDDQKESIQRAKLDGRPSDLP